jgi:hypothetical protein
MRNGSTVRLDDDVTNTLANAPKSNGSSNEVDEAVDTFRRFYEDFGEQRATS